jgi:hypothetical protein
MSASLHLSTRRSCAFRPRKTFISNSLWKSHIDNASAGAGEKMQSHDAKIGNIRGQMASAAPQGFLAWTSRLYGAEGSCHKGSAFLAVRRNASGGHGRKTGRLRLSGSFCQLQRYSIGDKL